MQPQELRIGNLVYANGETIRVTAINFDHLLKSVDVDEWYVSDEKLSDLHPITLTPEWLERMGLLNHEFMGVYEVVQLKSDGSKYGLYVEGQWTGTDFQYVHELQNLYFSLTGQEIEIKELV